MNYTVLLTLFVTVTSVCGSCRRCRNHMIKNRKPFNYKIERFTDNGQTTENKTGTVISNEKQAYYIQLQDNVTTLYKGMLNITEESHHFWAIKKGIKVIQPGVFDNQKITSQLILGRNLIRIIKRGTFKNMEITDLDLYDNQITTIEKRGFENLPKLKKLHLSNNRLTNFVADSVINTPSLNAFSIDFNKLNTLLEDSLSFLPGNNSVLLGASDNELTEIHPKVFGNGGKRLSSFWLANNKLQTLPWDIFRNNSVRILLIYNNNLTNLPEEFFELPDILTATIKLTGNEFNCATVSKLKVLKENRGADVEFDDTSNKCITADFSDYFKDFTGY